MKRATYHTAVTPTSNRLELVLPTLAGVASWSLAPTGELTIEYDEAQTNPTWIENAVEGLGYRLAERDDLPSAPST